MEQTLPQVTTTTRRISIPIFSILRGIFFVIIVVWIFYAPFYARSLDPNSKEGKAFNRWDMYHYTGNGVRDVEFFIRLPNGTMQELDRREVLNYETLDETNQHLVWRMDSQREIQYVASLLCEELDYEEDIRVISRIGTLEGWVDEYDGSQPMCGS